MKRWIRVQLVWLSLWALCVVPVWLFEPFTLHDVPVWLSVVIGAVIGLLLRFAAEAVIDRWMLSRFKRAWREATAEGKPPTVIE